MQIHDFHARFASTNEQGGLIQALRNLSLFEDLKSIFGGDPTGPDSIDWSPWSAMEVDAACPNQI
ncbi:MAG TPA: hypothetical protein VGG03_23205 [Thermoanaerobaculia bacterium]|jgi:hypothetical protein